MKPSYDDKILRGYLLGSLSAADTETCDELSFTDDAFGERLEAIENDLVDAYVRGELSSVEFGQFELYYLASARRREKVNFARSFQVFAAEQFIAAPAWEATPAVPVKRAAREDVSWWQSVRAWFALPPSSLQWGLAATASVFLLASGWLLTEIQRLHRQITAPSSEIAIVQPMEPALLPQLDPQTNANAQKIEQLTDELNRTEQQLQQLKRQQKLLARQAQARVAVAPLHFQHVELLPQTRSLKPLEVTLATDTDYAVLQLVTTEDDVETYQVELLTPDGQPRWKSGQLKARANGATRIVDVKVRAKLLPSGSHLVQLKGIAADGQVEDLRRYFFKVVKP